jgi:hypothetical protein
MKTGFTIPWERTRRIEGLWRRSQQRTQPSIPCPAWVGCTIATAGVRRRNRQFELTGRLFDERSGCRASGVAVGATAADSDEACAPTSGVPLRVNCSCGTRKQLRGLFSPFSESVAVCRFGIGYSQLADIRSLGFHRAESVTRVRFGSPVALAECLSAPERPLADLLNGAAGPRSSSSGRTHWCW